MTDVKNVEILSDHPNVELYLGDSISLMIIKGGINENLPILDWMHNHFFNDHVSMLVDHLSRYSLDLDIKILFF